MDEPTLIFETVHGSRAYGLAREGSDTDFKGIIVGPRRWYFGFLPAPEQIERSADHVWIELRKWTRLAAANNPTMLEMLYAEPEDQRVLHPAARRLLEARDRFLSKRVASTFGRYALSQLGRIQRHRRWLLHPPAKAPTRADYGLPERTVIPKTSSARPRRSSRRGRMSEAELTPSFLAILDRERRYRSALKEWRQHQHWLSTRNPARAALEARFGYDTKHAMHLVRLTRMAVEILESRRVVVRRPDREELLAVRDGAWSYDALLAEVERERARIAEAEASSSLPDAPDEEALDALSASLIAEVLAC
ncbi:MAG: nucleotidyltransferase domain-containing protein [Sandaracinaceae bacterium]|nr:nucleotidyltransferase domain-containing protein [Sandaracinaceae bacterium]